MFRVGAGTVVQCRRWMSGPFAALQTGGIGALLLELLIVNERLPEAGSEAAFEAGLLNTTLARLRWASAVLLLIVLTNTLLNALNPAIQGTSVTQADRITLGVWLLLALLLHASLKPNAPMALRRATVLAYLIATLTVSNVKIIAYVHLDMGYMPIFVIPVIAASTLFLMRPLLFLGLLWAAEGLHLFLLFHASIVSITDSVPVRVSLVATGLAHFIFVMLYRAQRAEFRQVRELRRANDRLQQLNRELGRRQEDMNEMMAVAAHDLRSPLFGLRNLLNLAAHRRSYDQVRLNEILGHSSRACDEMLSLISRMLEAHECEDGTPASLQATDLRHSVRAALRRLEVQAAAKSISVHCEVPAEPAVACVDAEGLERALDNLLSNACKFSPAGSRVCVRLVADTGGGWILEVQDEGPGIPAAERAQLFRKFKRGSSVAAAGEPGSGLGLFIAHSRLCAMGGDLRYDAAQPVGSIFRMHLR